MRCIIAEKHENAYIILTQSEREIINSFGVLFIWN